MMPDLSCPSLKFDTGGRRKTQKQRKNRRKNKKNNSKKNKLNF